MSLKTFALDTHAQSAKVQETTKRRKQESDSKRLLDLFVKRCEIDDAMQEHLRVKSHEHGAFIYDNLSDVTIFAYFDAGHAMFHVVRDTDVSAEFSSLYGLGMQLKTFQPAWEGSQVRRLLNMPVVTDAERYDQLSVQQINKWDREGKFYRLITVVWGDGEAWFIVDTQPEKTE
jgi:hypothetical protein